MLASGIFLRPAISVRLTAPAAHVKTSSKPSGEPYGKCSQVWPHSLRYVKTPGGERALRKEATCSISLTVMPEQQTSSPASDRQNATVMPLRRTDRAEH